MLLSRPLAPVSCQGFFLFASLSGGASPLFRLAIRTGVRRVKKHVHPPFAGYPAARTGGIERKEMNGSLRWSLMMVVGCMLGAAVIAPPAHAKHHNHDQRSQRYQGQSSAPLFNTMRAVDARQGRPVYQRVYRYRGRTYAPSTTRTSDARRRAYYRRRYGYTLQPSTSYVWQPSGGYVWQPGVSSVWQPVSPSYSTMRVAGARQYYRSAASRRWRSTRGAGTRHHRHYRH
jgi:hypothetical protein